MKNLVRIFGDNYKSVLIIIAIMIYLFSVNASHKFWTHQGKIIEWDVKSYYSFLPAAFIQNDLTFEFLKKEDNKHLRKYYWPVQADNGKLISITSMGMSYVYFPAFIIANQVAQPLGYEKNGFSRPYKFAIVLLGYIYLLIGLIYLRKILLLYFSDFVTTVTLLAVTLGTNLLYYATYESGMTHVYNFTFITIFLYNVIKFYQKPSFNRIIIMGLLSGLITLIRPVNIIVLLLFIFWNISSLNHLKDRIKLFWNIKGQILFMIFMFIVPWIPQFMYWKIQTGHFLFFTYGIKDGKFFFDNPQISNFLFSYWKGWLLYTPIMIFSLIGLIIMLVKNKPNGLMITLYAAFVVYILSSWWSWWFGGSFGQRSMIDIYGVLALPLAYFVKSISAKKYISWGVLTTFVLLISYNIFQKNQFLEGSLHYWGMTKAMYWEQFLKIMPTQHYKSITKIPDYEAAHLGYFRQVSPKALELRKEIKDKSKIKTQPQVYLAFWKKKIEQNDIDSLISKYPDINTLSTSSEKADFLYKNINKGLSDKDLIKHYESLIKHHYLPTCLEKSKKQNLPIDSIIHKEAIGYYNQHLNEEQLLDVLITPQLVDAYLAKEITYSVAFIANTPSPIQ